MSVLFVRAVVKSYFNLVAFAMIVTSKQKAMKSLLLNKSLRISKTSQSASTARTISTCKVKSIVANAFPLNKARKSLCKLNFLNSAHNVKS